MFQNSQTMLHVFGIPIRIAPSWLLIAALITWSLASNVYPATLPGRSAQIYLGLGLVTMFLFIGSLLLHELAHALVARHLGIAVPRITLFLFGGVAELEDEPDTPAKELRIAVAGPAMSFALAVAFWILSVPLSAAGPVVTAVLGNLVFLNLVLAVFNLLPAFPLDGGRVLRALLWAQSGDALRATEQAARMGEYLAFALIGLGVLSLFQGAELGGAWQILIGVFVLFAARSAVASQNLKAFLGDQTVAQLMTPDAITTRPEVSLADLVNRVMLPNSISFVPVVDGDDLLGYIDTIVLAKIDRENWANTQVGDVFVELKEAETVSPHQKATDVLRRFTRTSRRKLLVTEDRKLKGIITLSDLSRTFALLSELHATPRRS